MIPQTVLTNVINSTKTCCDMCAHIIEVYIKYFKIISIHFLLELFLFFWILFVTYVWHFYCFILQFDIVNSDIIFSCIFMCYDITFNSTKIHEIYCSQFLQNPWFYACKANFRHKSINFVMFELTKTFFLYYYNYSFFFKLNFSEILQYGIFSWMKSPYFTK